MKKVLSSGKLGRAMLNIITMLALVGIFALAPVATNKVAAASATLPINMIYYGWFDAATNQRIINAHPQALVSNSAAGPWRSNADVGLFRSAGIQYYEYLDGGYENTRTGSIPTDLWSNLSYIEAAARAGAYGIFLDQVSDGVYTAANYYYLQQIADKAHGLGLKVVFNTGMFVWADQLMNYCDFINSSETWSNAPLTASQSKWASRTWLLTYGIYDATTATNLTLGAWSKGINGHFATSFFGSLPYWFESYISQLTPNAPTTYVQQTTTFVQPTTGQASVTFISNPSGAEVWLDYTYRGNTPLTLTITAGSHYVGFNRYGYNSNVPLVGTFVVGSTSLTVNGDLLAGWVSSSGLATSAQTAVTFSSNVAGIEVWLDYAYKGVTPLTLMVPAGSHRIGFYKHGYHYNQPVVVDFYLSGQSNLNILADMLTGYTSVW
jgi:hypothetical protein